MKFTEKLDMLMKANGLNKRSFAQKCDIPYTTVCGWYDRGYDGVRMSTIRKIAEAFNTDLEYWAYDDVPENEKSPAPEGAEDAITMEESNRLFDLLVQLGMIKDGISLSDDDTAFLTHVFGLLDIWGRSKRK